MQQRRRQQLELLRAALRSSDIPCASPCYEQADDVRLGRAELSRAEKKAAAAVGICLYAYSVAASGPAGFLGQEPSSPAAAAALAAS